MLRTRCALSCSSILPSVDFRRRIPSFTFRSALVDSDHLMMFVAVSCAPIHWFRKPWTHQDSCFVVFILATTINRRLLFIAMHPASFLFACLSVLSAPLTPLRFPFIIIDERVHPVFIVCARALVQHRSSSHHHTVLRLAVPHIPRALLTYFSCTVADSVIASTVVLRVFALLSFWLVEASSSRHRL